MMQNTVSMFLVAMVFIAPLLRAQPSVEVYVDGAGSFREPEGLAVDEEGNVYTGGAEGKIWRITPEREIVLHAEIGGRANGMCLDGAGNLYVCDKDRHAVLKVNTEGTVSTFCSEVEGTPMVWPNYPAFDLDGALFVSDFDTSRNRVYRITPDGTGNLFIGPEAGIVQPNGVAIDATGTFLYVNETFERRVWKVPILRGGGEVSAGSPEVFASWPPEMGRAADSIQFDTDSNAYVATADYTGPIEILKIDPAGNVSVWVTSEHLVCPTTAVFGAADLSEMFVANLCSTTIARIYGTGLQGLPLVRPLPGDPSSLRLR